MLDKTLQIFTDGGSRGNPGPAASAFVALDNNSQVVYQQGIYLGNTTNNQAEYQAVLLALKWLAENLDGYTHVQFNLDSQLVVNQINGTFKIKDPALKVHLIEILHRIQSLKNISILFRYVPRAQNFRADALVNQTLDSSLTK